jgi:hypothetical protein
LHQFTGVFSGTPGENTTAPWPVTLTSGSKPTSPVYDDTSGKAFVADAGGYVYSVTAAGAVIKSAQLSGGFTDSPILDPSNEQIYLASNSVNIGGGCGTNNSAIYQLATGFGSGSGATNTSTIGTCGATASVPVFNGTFDNLYYGGSAGHMYVCGNAGGDPTVYQIAVSPTGNITGGAATAGPVLTTAAATCSPITEIYNGTTDRMFLAVTHNSKTTSPVSCPSNTTGCVVSYDITTGSSWSSTTTTSAQIAATGGASGIIVDGDSTAAGASQVYYTPLVNGYGDCTTTGQYGIGGCAIQASQSGLN